MAYISIPMREVRECNVIIEFDELSEASGIDVSELKKMWISELYALVNRYMPDELVEKFFEQSDEPCLEPVERTEITVHR